MIEKTNQLVIIGDGETAEIAYEYFTYDSPYEVIAFSVETKYIKKSTLYDLPVIPFEDVWKKYPNDATSIYVALSYTQLNRPHTRLYHAVKDMGYTLATYISSKAFVWRNVEIGENCFIFENNVLQHHVKVGNNVILWSGNHIGHRTVIQDNCYLSSHVVVSGYCEIGKNCFLGVNSTLSDNIKIADDCIIGAGSLVLKNTEPGKVYIGSPAKPMSASSFATFGVKEENH